MLTDFRKLLDAVAVRAGWKAGEIRSKMFRHTYCAARLQTVDQGAPVSTYTVAREMGHGGEAMVRRVYGHLGQVRHRAEAVEYRVEQHAAKLGGRHRSSVVELSIRNRAVVGSNPTGGSVFSALLLAFRRLPFPAPARVELLIDTPFDRGYSSGAQPQGSTFMTAQPPRPSVPRSSFAAALKDYTFIRPGIAVSVSAACLIAALIIGVFLISSLKRATAIVDVARRTVFTLHGYNAALQTWQQLVVTEDPELKKPESRALRDRIRSALTGELQKLAAATQDASQRTLIETVIKGLQAGNVGLNEAGRQAMVVVLARQDEAMLEAVGVSQRAVLLSAVLIALTVVAAGTLVVPMAWLYIRFKRGALIRVAA